MKTRLACLMVALALAGVFVASPAGSAKKSDGSDVITAAQDNNAFALDLYSRVADGDSNLIFSPFSVVSALGMTYAGARGETATEMEKAMHFSLGQEKLHPALGQLTRDLNKRGKDGGYELAVANRLWGHKDYKFLDSFTDLVKANYGAGLETVDFGNPEAARKTINGWVEKQTRDKIKDLLPEGILSAMTRLVLTNAIYFKGKWETEFKKSDTQDAEFTLASGDKVQVPTMYQKQTFGLGAGPGCRILEMDYKGGDVSMVVLLPEAPDGLSALAKELDATKLADWIGALSKEEVMVYLPKFKLEYNLDLKKKLMAMGMVQAFDQSAADLSGMDGTKDLFIFAALHKAFVEVNEEGTEAAAATAVVINVKSAEQQMFRADHPFLFLIRDKQSGAILFLGRVMDPR